MENKIYDIVVKFMIDNDIDCAETIYQSERAMEGAYEFIEELFELVKDNLNVGR